MKLRLAILALLFCCQSIKAQDYFAYQRICNRADNDIQANDLPTAAQRYDSLYKNYQFIYGFHSFKALQVACKLQDEARICKWLTKCITQGIPLWMVRANDITNPILNYNYTQTIIQAYDSLHSIHLSSIDTVLANRMWTMILKDQRRTEKVNNGFFLFKVVYYPRWLYNNKKQLDALIKIMDTIGYPGEKLCGFRPDLIDSTIAYNLFKQKGPTCIRHTSGQTMLMHAYSNPRRDIQDKLYKNVANGNMPAYQYAIAVDFMAEYGRQKYGTYSHYYEWFRRKSTPADTIAVVDIRRHAIGLNTLAQAEKNGILYNQYYREHKTNSAILPE